MSAVRRWWVDKRKRTTIGIEDYSEWVEVVEAAAYEALEKQIGTEHDVTVWRDKFAKFQRDLATVQGERDRLVQAIVWALGYTNFAARKDGQGAYWWRSELRQRSGLTSDELEQAALAQPAAPSAPDAEIRDVPETDFGIK